MEHTNANRIPCMMTIRQVAATGILSEYVLRQMQKQGKLPSFTAGKKVFVNYDALIEQLKQLKGGA